MGFLTLLLVGQWKICGRKDSSMELVSLEVRSLPTVRLWVARDLFRLEAALDLATPCRSASGLKTDMADGNKTAIPAANVQQEDEQGTYPYFHLMKIYTIIIIIIIIIFIFIIIIASISPSDNRTNG